MAQLRAEKRVVVSPDADALSEKVATRLLNRVGRRAATGKQTHLLISGGTAVTAVLRAAGSADARRDVDWSRVHLWWADERFVPADSPERNVSMARDALLSHIDLPEENVHAFAASDGGIDLDAAARAYAEDLERHAARANPWPDFSECFLGVGPDGHIASLFPDRTEIADLDNAVLPVRHSPVPPSDRLTVTRRVINSARRVWMILPGADKASALGLALAGASYHSVPAAGAKGRRHTIFFVDEAAAGDVPEELIDPDF
ncbi:6-phosphogluconolactonase [Microbacterium sp.]|uniref:6-phosphogluconolactonase n=1 Tax=Microbacterium sp. TaxID=51671 RepID=UPI003736B80C